jgi:hypothetical protein
VELQIRRGAIVHLDGGAEAAGVAAVDRAVGKDVDLPVTGIDRLRIVGDEGRTGQGRA